MNPIALSSDFIGDNKSFLLTVLTLTEGQSVII